VPSRISISPAESTASTRSTIVLQAALRVAGNRVVAMIHYLHLFPYTVVLVVPVIGDVAAVLGSSSLSLALAITVLIHSTPGFYWCYSGCSKSLNRSRRR